MSLTYSDDIDTIVDRLADLNPIQKDTLKFRYRLMMAEYRHRCRVYTALFYVLRITMTVGSLAVPALLSIQNTASPNIYWFTWGLSLAVTTSNGILTLFKLDKRFFTLHATAERLRTETYQYLTLSGRYSGHHGHHIHVRPTHASQYVYYCSQIEKIHMKQVDEEYIKVGDADGAHPQSGPQPGAIQPLVPSPADQAILSTPARPRSESHDTIGTYESPNAKTKEGIALSVSDIARQPVSEHGTTRITILPAPPAMSTEPSLDVGTTLPAGTIQSEPPRSEDA